MKITQMTDKELYKHCRSLGSMVIKFRNQFIGTLPEVSRRQLYRKHKMASIYEFAAKLAGISNEMVDKVLNLDKKLEDKPVLREKLTTGEIGWSKLQIVASIATPETEELWAKKVEVMSSPALETLIHDLRLPQTDTETVSHMGDFKEFRAALSEENIQKLNVFKQKNKTLTWNEAITKLLELAENPTRTRLTKPSAKTTRYVPAHIKKQQSLICTHPNCKKPAETLHHKVPFSIAKSHNSIIPLCKQHHELAHTSIYKNQKTFEIELTKPLNYIDRKIQQYKLGFS